MIKGIPGAERRTGNLKNEKGSLKKLSILKSEAFNLLSYLARYGSELLFEPDIIKG